MAATMSIELFISYHLLSFKRCVDFDVCFKLYCLFVFSFAKGYKTIIKKI